MIIQIRRINKMQNTSLTLDCDTMFSEEGAVEIYVYLGDSDSPTVFSFDLTDIITSNLNMYTIPDFRHSNVPYMRSDDIEAERAIDKLKETLQDGLIYIDKLRNELLDNEPDHEDSINGNR
tara:strand:+ start:2350 stop:2712 length:363 start_codon:yes stop_codon:yes gene_type:complete